jgi:hypothetical protein
MHKAKGIYNMKDNALRGAGVFRGNPLVIA